MTDEPTRPRMLPIIIGNAFEWFDFTLYGLSLIHISEPTRPY